MTLSAISHYRGGAIDEVAPLAQTLKAIYLQYGVGYRLSRFQTGPNEGDWLVVHPPRYAAFLTSPSPSFGHSSTSFSERDSRSSFQTTTVSPSRRWSSIRCSSGRSQRPPDATSSNKRWQPADLSALACRSCSARRPWTRGHSRAACCPRPVAVGIVPKGKPIMNGLPSLKRGRHAPPFPAVQDRAFDRAIEIAAEQG